MPRFFVLGAIAALFNLQPAEEVEQECALP